MAAASMPVHRGAELVLVPPLPQPLTPSVLQQAADGQRHAGKQPPEPGSSKTRSSMPAHFANCRKDAMRSRREGSSLATAHRLAASLASSPSRSSAIRSSVSPPSPVSQSGSSGRKRCMAADGACAKRRCTRNLKVGQAAAGSMQVKRAATQHGSRSLGQLRQRRRRRRRRRRRQAGQHSGCGASLPHCTTFRCTIGPAARSRKQGGWRPATGCARRASVRAARSSNESIGSPVDDARTAAALATPSRAPATAPAS